MPVLSALLLQTSLLAHPLYLGEEPPELRTARNVLLLHGGADAPGVQRTPEQALELAADLVRRLRAGVPFEEVARAHSDDPMGRAGAVMGTFAPGMLEPAIDTFLFAAEVGEISDPLPVGGGVQIVQRVERQAAVLAILVAGADAEARVARIRERLAAGEDFAALARELSDDPLTRERGGQLAIFERGRNDQLLKAAAFRARVGEVVGPVRTLSGLHLLKRVELAEVDARLAEDNWIRARAILIQHDLAKGADPATARPPDEAKRIADEVERRLAAGEDMARIARELDEDPGGRERAGDLGWLHRNSPTLARFLDRVLRAAVGEPIEPLSTDYGWVILRRER